MEPNPHEELARERKVRRLVDAILHYNAEAPARGKAPFTSEDAILTTKDEWKLIADSIGVRTPGPVARLKVARELRKLEKIK